MTVQALLEFMLRRQVRALFRIYPGMLLGADAVALRCRQRLKSTAARCPRELADLQKRHKRSLRDARTEARQLWNAAKQRLNEALPVALERYHQRKEDADLQLEADLLALDKERERRLIETQQVYDASVDEAETTLRRRIEEIEGGYDRVWQMTAKAWRNATAEVRETLAAVWEESSRLFPPWDDPCWADRPLAAVVPPVLQFGRLEVGKGQIPELIPTEEKLASEAVEDFVLPALCAFPDKASMLFLAQDAGRALAVEALQAVLFRLLTCIPPGKVRFTIIDPVGLGQNFAAFMDLADHDELLVSSRIWTEVGHIEQRMADLTAHMENVIQKYLRDRYPTIGDYNAMAGEVAEPFRILVIANFPTNFTPESARRLVSIAQNGPRCGVLTLISVDRKQPMPDGFDLNDLKRAGVRLIWEEDKFVWDDEDFKPFPLTLDGPPDAALGAKILDQVGRLSRAARRVEVPFEFIAPRPRSGGRATVTPAST